MINKLKRENFRIFGISAMGLLLFPHHSFATTESPSYCIALRGNGELMPAHLGALAQTIETFGLPSASAGGSSASFSIFVLDSILANPLLMNLDEKTKAIYAATMIKSIEGFTKHTFQKSQWQDFFDFLKKLKKGRSLEALKAALATAGPDRYNNIVAALNKIKEGQIFYGRAIQRLHSKLLEKKFDSKPWRIELDNLIAQAKEGISALGKFDAKNDTNIFLRDPILNFSAIAGLFDQLASFYSLSQAEKATTGEFLALLKNCGPGSLGKTWMELVQSNPQCQQQLGSLIDSYFKTPRPLLRIKNLVGSSHSAMISTGIIRGKSAESLKQAKSRYDQDFSPNHGAQLKFNPDEIYYGYMGQPSTLSTVKNYLNNINLPDAQIDKSKRFLGLGAKTWMEAVTLSASEPGLAPFNPTTMAPDQEEVLSTGGWSDLHPVVLLKAAGCKNVLYITRKGGDTIFGQGVSKRLFGFAKPWEELDPYEPNKSKNEVLNNNGDPNDKSSQWSKMFNLANPQSNFDYALQTASIVKCTDWNRFEITAEEHFSQMILESYRAPYYLNSSSPLKSLDLVQPSVITKKDNTINVKGFPEWAGCISFSGKSEK